MTDNKRSNFYKLLKDKNIVIPIIQRDYVQGKTTSKINGIREGLICDMLNSLKYETKIDFQYIYGIYKEGACYLPIDGQQRLTSMFLFTWGMSILAGNDSAKKLANLKKFSYQVREASTDFFRSLQEFDDSENLKYYEDFKDFMTNNGKRFEDFSWFKGKWKNDQTVRSTLVFLDCLRQELTKCNYNYKKFLDSILSDDCPFEFFLIAQNEISHYTDKSEKEKQDEAFEAENRAATTYINMNARGKALNEFENFKALLHKCEYKDKNAHGGKDFIRAYESHYIHILVKYIDHYDKNNLSLSEKIEKMDRFTLNLLIYIYNDIWKIKQKKKEEQNDIYRFMYLIKENKCKCDDIFDEDYFDFIKYVMEHAEPKECNGNKEFDHIFYNYSNNHTYRDQWNFMVKYWVTYRLEKAKIDMDGWNVFSNHLDISIDTGKNGIADRWCRYVSYDNRYILNNILNQVCDLDSNSSKTIESFLANVNIEDFLTKVCGNANGIDSLNLGYERLLEEKIKANIYIKEQGNDKDCKQVLNKEKQLRYLLYMAGYYDSNGNYCENGQYDDFKKYLNFHEQIDGQIIQPTVQWRKIYYMSAIDLQAKPLNPPTDSQCWSEEIRLWKGKNIPRDKLNRVKNIFDSLINNKLILDDMVSNYQRMCTDISCWLYYLLHRDIIEIINGLITKKNGNNPGYIFLERDYYEYVLEKDLLNKGYTVANKNMEETTISCEQISPRKDKDEQTRNRNPEFIISPYYSRLPSNTMISQGIWYRFEFNGFDQQSNNEDTFKLWKDTAFSDTSSREYNTVKDLVNGVIKNLSSDDLCDLIYKKDTSNFEEKLKQLPLNTDWVVDSVKNEGANKVRIKIKCNKQPFGNDSFHEFKHSDIITP